jgi:hypothetical protein
MAFTYVSTLARVRQACNQAGPTNVVDPDLMQCLAAVSTMIQTYMSRWIQVQERTETKWSNRSGISFLGGSPVRSVSNFEYCIGGTWSAIDPARNPSQVYVVDDNELHYPRLPDRTPLRITYTGGMAYSVDTSVESISAVTGTPTAGELFTSISGSTGKIVTFDSVAMTAAIQIATGGLSYGDILTGATSHATLAIGATIQESILSDYADIAKAADMQTAYMYQRRNSLGRTATTSGNGTTSFEKDYEILPGVKQILEFYDPQATI